MNISVRLFAGLAERAGAEQTLVFADPPTVGELRRAFAAAWPGSGRPLVAVNLAYADDAQLITQGDEVALIPPVAGG